MEVLTINESKECTGGFKISVGLGVFAGGVVTFLLGVFNGIFSPNCAR